MSANKRIIFIVNPLSGTSGKNMAIQLIEKHLDKSLWDYDIVKTGYIGHATEIAREAARHGVDVVCAVGGDGTVNETARGLIHTSGQAFLHTSGVRQWVGTSSSYTN